MASGETLKWLAAGAALVREDVADALARAGRLGDVRCAEFAEVELAEWPPQFLRGARGAILLAVGA